MRVVAIRGGCTTRFDRFGPPAQHDLLRERTCRRLRDAMPRRSGNRRQGDGESSSDARRESSRQHGPLGTQTCPARPAGLLASTRRPGDLTVPSRAFVRKFRSLRRAFETGLPPRDPAARAFGIGVFEFTPGVCRRDVRESRRRCSLDMRRARLAGMVKARTGSARAKRVAASRRSASTTTDDVRDTYVDTILQRCRHAACACSSASRFAGNEPRAYSPSCVARWPMSDTSQ